MHSRSVKSAREALSYNVKGAGIFAPERTEASRKS